MGTPQSTSPAPAPQPSWPPTGRGCSRIFQYENPKTTKLLTSFLPRFPPGATPQDRTRVLIIIVTPPPAVTGSPVQPRSLDFDFQPGVGLLPSLRLDRVSVIYAELTLPGVGMRGTICHRCQEVQSQLYDKNIRTLLYDISL